MDTLRETSGWSDYESRLKYGTLGIVIRNVALVFFLCNIWQVSFLITACR